MYTIIMHAQSIGMNDVEKSVLVGDKQLKNEVCCVRGEAGKG